MDRWYLEQVARFTVEESATASRPRALLVMGDREFDILYSMALIDYEMDVASAATNEEATRLCAERSFDVILIDLSTSEAERLELAGRLRQTKSVAASIIFVSKRTEDDDLVARALAVGDDFFTRTRNLRLLQSRVQAAVRRARIVCNFEDVQNILISMAQAVEAKDGATAGHCERLSYLSVMLGRRFGLPGEDLEALRRGGFLHDIGKIGISDAILLKPARLTPEERKVMESHVRIGFDLLAPLKTMERTLPIVLRHHEHFDGSGYPDGLKGAEIPYAARIFQVLDVWDALTSIRPYKPALSDAEALEILEEEVRKGFWDPDVIAGFRAFIDEDPGVLEKIRSATAEEAVGSPQGAAGESPPASG